MCSSYSNSQTFLCCPTTDLSSLHIYLPQSANLCSTCHLLASTTPPCGAAHMDTLSRWLRDVMSTSGMDLTLFSPKYLRGSTASTVISVGIPIDRVLALGAGLQTASSENAATNPSSHQNPDPPPPTDPYPPGPPAHRPKSWSHTILPHNPHIPPMAAHLPSTPSQPPPTPSLLITFQIYTPHHSTQFMLHAPSFPTHFSALDVRLTILLTPGACIHCLKAKKTYSVPCDILTKTLPTVHPDRTIGAEGCRLCLDRRRTIHLDLS